MGLPLCVSVCCHIVVIALTVDRFLWPTLSESVLPCALMFCGNLLTGVKLPKLNRDRVIVAVRVGER